MTDRYRIIFKGEIQEGQSLETVKKNLGILFKMDINKINRLFSSLPAVIKKDIDLNMASKYLDVFKKAGALCQVESMITDQETMSDSNQPGEIQEKYEVIFDGKLSEGHNLIAVKEKLAILFKMDKSKIDQLFSHLPFVIKKNVDFETASKYQTAMKQAGTICHIKRMIPAKCVDSVGAESQTDSCEQQGRSNIRVSSQGQDPSKAVVCPKCYFEQELSKKCDRCGYALDYLFRAKTEMPSSPLQEANEELISAEAIPSTDENSDQQPMEFLDKPFPLIPSDDEGNDSRLSMGAKADDKKGLSKVMKVIIGIGIGCIILIFLGLAGIGFLLHRTAVDFQRIDNQPAHVPEGSTRLPPIHRNRPAAYPLSETSLQAFLQKKYMLLELRELSDLDLSFIPVTDLDPLKDLENLSTLNLTGTLVKDLTPLKDLANLSNLNLSFTQVNDLRPLRDLKNLSLDLSNTRLNDLSLLKELNNLIVLKLNFNPATDLSPLKNCKNLCFLDLWNTPVSDLRPLKDLENLTYLNLWKTPVTDLNPLKKLINLSSLNLRFTQVSDLSPLSGLKNLSSIDLAHTPVKDLSPLADLKNLSSLNLWDTQVSDLSPISSLINLSKLFLWSTPVTDLSPLFNLANLSYLDVSKGQIEDEVLVNLKRAIPDIEIKVIDTEMN